MPIPDCLAPALVPSPASVTHLITAGQRRPSVIRIEIEVELGYQINFCDADFIFNIHAANTGNQRVITESLVISQDCEPTFMVDPLTATRTVRLHAHPGDLRVCYQATVDLQHHLTDPRFIDEVPVRHLPAEVLAYLYPSRYCQADRLLRFSSDEFGQMPQGYSRVRAICNWVNSHVKFTSNSTDATTSAIDTLVQRTGVCRDFAHLMIALCRAINIPARFVTGTDFGCISGFGPPDFHAYVEVYLADRWYLFDPTGMTIERGLIRIATGRDAADVAFATIFGNVQGRAPRISAMAVPDSWASLQREAHVPVALSVDGG